MAKEYDAFIRDIVHHEGLCDDCDVTRVKLEGERLAVVLENYDHVLPEAADGVRELILAALKAGEDEFALKSIGTWLIEECRRRARTSFNLDLECTASDIAMQAEEDREYEGAGA